MKEMIAKLEQTFKDVTDITDPSSMDMVLMILDEIRMEDDEYMEILVNRLKDQEVTWEQPWYQLSYCLTRKPPPSENEEDNYATGHFTKEEGDQIERNWNEFVTKYKVPNKPTCLARWRNRNKIKNKRCPEEWVRYYVTAYLAQGLKRNVYQVNRYFLQYYGHPIKLKHYTPTEEKIMEIGFYHRPRDAGVVLSTVLGREPRGIYKRLEEYYNGKPDNIRLKWTLNLASKLVHQLLEHSGCTLKELKNNEFDQSVWLKLANDIGQQYKHIQSFWYSTLHVQLFAKCAVKTISLRKMICKKLQKSQYQIWTDIRWKDVVKEFPDGFTAAFLHRVAHRMVRRYADFLTSPLPEVLARALRDRKLKWRQRRLKTLKLSKRGHLKYTLHDIAFKQLMKSH